MLHYLPKKDRTELAGEIRRVLKPGGRVLAIDFGGPTKDRKSFLDHIHRRHGHVDFREIISLFSEAGLAIAESGAVGMRELVRRGLCPFPQALAQTLSNPEGERHPQVFFVVHFDQWEKRPTFARANLRLDSIPRYRV